MEDSSQQEQSSEMKDLKPKDSQETTLPATLVSQNLTLEALQAARDLLKGPPTIMDEAMIATRREQMNAWLKQRLNREPTVSRLKDGSFMADYFERGAPATKFIGATEEEAFLGLLAYLINKPESV